jgi:catechol 2,3-dioxygenase
MSATSLRPSPATTTAQDSIVYGAVHLDVSDRDRSVAFWAGLIGLQVLSTAESEVRLGVEGRELLVLHPGASTPTPRGHSGLYHLALHLPSEAEFARVLLRIAQADYPQAPTDHIMHWATYLADPDGIGLELSFETLDRFSHYTSAGGRPAVVDNQGQLRSAVDQLDLQEVISFLPDRELGQPLPEQTRVGHIHLHVSDLQNSADFYRNVVGFIPNMQEPLFGMADMQAGGSFPHRIALNEWQGHGAPQRPAGTAGLNHFELRLRSQEQLKAAVAEYKALAGTAAEQQSDGMLIRDPAGNTITLAVEPAALAAPGAAAAVAATAD